VCACWKCVAPCYGSHELFQRAYMRGRHMHTYSRTYTAHIQIQIQTYTYSAPGLTNFSNVYTGEDGEKDICTHTHIHTQHIYRNNYIYIHVQAPGYGPHELFRRACTREKSRACPALMSAPHVHTYTYTSTWLRASRTSFTDMYARKTYAHIRTYIYSTYIDTDTYIYIYEHLATGLTNFFDPNVRRACMRGKSRTCHALMSSPHIRTFTYIYTHTYTSTWLRASRTFSTGMYARKESSLSRADVSALRIKSFFSFPNSDTCVCVCEGVGGGVGGRECLQDLKFSPLLIQKSVPCAYVCVCVCVWGGGGKCEGLQNKESYCEGIPPPSMDYDMQT